MDDNYQTKIARYIDRNDREILEIALEIDMFYFIKSVIKN